MKKLRTESERTGFSFFIPAVGKSIKIRTPDGLSVFTVEMMAIYSSLDWIEKNRVKKSIICTDSLSVLLTINSRTNENRVDIFVEIFECLFRLNILGIEVRFMWVPAHRGIEGNEMADYYAKQAIKLETVIENPFSIKEVKSIIKKQIMNEWQEKWVKGKKGRHLFNIQKEVGKMKLKELNNREQTIISRLRIGHSRLNSTLYIMGKYQTGLCKCGKEKETVEHILCYCSKYKVVREQLKDKLKMKRYGDWNLETLLNENNKIYKLVLEFLRKSKLVNRI